MQHCDHGDGSAGLCEAILLLPLLGSRKISLVVMVAAITKGGRH